MLLEICQGGEVFSRLVAMNVLDEATTQFYVARAPSGSESVDYFDRLILNWSTFHGHTPYDTEPCIVSR